MPGISIEELEALARFRDAARVQYAWVFNRLAIAFWFATSFTLLMLGDKEEQDGTK